MKFVTCTKVFIYHNLMFECVNRMGVNFKQMQIFFSRLNASKSLSTVLKQTYIACLGSLLVSSEIFQTLNAFQRFIRTRVGPLA